MRLALLLAAAVIVIRDPTGKWAGDPLEPWFQSLQSKDGFYCCARADGRPLPKRKKTMINKQQIAALIKAVEEGGDDDDEITEDEAIAILRDTGLDAEIPSVRELFAWERSQKRPQ